MRYPISTIAPAIVAISMLLTLPANALLTEEQIKEMADEAKSDLVQNGFSFSFPDLKGNVVTNEDDQYKGKVLLVDIFGTWCRPCRREAPFLGGLYEKYGGKGLEIVSISFEFGDDKSKNIKKIKKFRKEFDTQYTTLYGGPTDDAKNVLPLPLARLGYPAVILIDREGVVQVVEAGFWDNSAQEIETNVKALLGDAAEISDRP